jgi:hypothetical protein
MGRATRVFAAVFGSLAALAGMEHGVSELLQGSARPAGLVIQSWPSGHRPQKRRGDEYDGRHDPGRLRDALRLHS